MKLRTLLNVQKAVEERETPYDVLEFYSTYYSKSKSETIDILDLHLTHAIRILNKYLLEDSEYSRLHYREKINDSLKDINDKVENIKEVVNK